MSTSSSFRADSEVRAESPPVLIVAGTATTHLAAGALESEGLSTIAFAGFDAGGSAGELCPDLIIVGRGDEYGPAEERALRRLHRRDGGHPKVILIGPSESFDPLVPGHDRMPGDVTVEELLIQIREALTRPPPIAATRSAVPEAHLLEAAERELQLARVSRRPGLLAKVGIAELEQIGERFGPQAKDDLDGAFEELFALDANVLEQHSSGPDGFWLLMPEADLATGERRLQALSRRVAATVIKIGTEQVRITPVSGYAPFAGAASGRALFEQAEKALQSAYAHLDLLPVRFSPALDRSPAPATAPKGSPWLTLIDSIALPAQILFTLTVLLSVPFLAYVAAWHAGLDITVVTYPLIAVALAGTAAALWVEGLRAVGPVDPPSEPAGDFPAATAIVAAYLPNEAATIIETVTNLLGQDYPGDLQVILAYNTPRPLPVEDTLAELAASDTRLLALRVSHSTSKAQNINAALAHVRGEFVGIFDADHHPAQGSFSRAWRWLSRGTDVVQGHCVVRNGDSSWVARLIAVEFETIYAVSHPGRARLHGFGIFGGSNGYWRRDALRQIRMQRAMLTEDIDSSMRSLQDGFKIVSDPALVSSELAPVTLRAVWHQRMRWAQGWTQTAWRHLGPALSSPRLNRRQKLGAAFLLGWAQLVPWVTIQVIPIVAFTVWRDGGFGHLDWVVPLFLLLSIFTFSAGGIQVLLAYFLADRRIRRRRSWFVIYALHSLLWFGEFKNVIVRVAQLKELIGEHQWRVTPRGP